MTIGISFLKYLAPVFVIIRWTSTLTCRACMFLTLMMVMDMVIYKSFTGHIGPFGLHDWTDRGQRSNGAFAATPYIDYYEVTRDVSFLNTTAYPFVREVVRDNTWQLLSLL